MKHRIMFRFLFLLCLLAPLEVFAVLDPACGKGKDADSRICTLEYQPNQVYKIYGFLGFPTVIIFDEGETVEQRDLIRGYKNAWVASTEADGGGNTLKIELKVDHGDDARTNLFVRTKKGNEKRWYVFELNVSRTDGVAASAQEKGMTWLVRFNYSPRNTLKDEKEFEFTGKENFRYQACGDKKEFPYLSWDDGKFMFLWFYNEQEIPAVFAVDSDKEERMVNSHMQGASIKVVHRVVDELRLRGGKSVVCIKRSDLIAKTHSP